VQHHASMRGRPFSHLRHWHEGHGTPVWPSGMVGRRA
jgi:hypothetical protein